MDGIKIFEHNIPTEFYIKGDRRIMSIAAASVVAKVTRDKLLENYHQQFPQYNFNQHKGYGTRLHQERLEKYGPSLIHRHSYQPIINYREELDI